MSEVMDIVSNLPVELSHRIFSYLNAKELAVCSAVSKKWRLLSNNDYLWRKFSPRREKNVPLSITEKSGLEPMCDQRLWYNRQAVSTQKWKKGSYWMHETQSGAGFATIANGAILVEWLERELKVYNLNDGECRFLHSLEVHLPRICLMPRCYPTVNGDAVIIRANYCHCWDYLVINANYGYYCMCYRWTGEGLEFTDCVYLRAGKVDLRSSTHSYDMPEPFSKLAPIYIQLITRDNILVLSDFDASRLYFWSIEGKKMTGLIELASLGNCVRFNSVHTRNGLIYLCCTRQMFVFDPNATLMNRVEFDLSESYINRDFRLHFNETTILAAFLSRISCYISAWSYDCSSLCPTFQLECECGTLHPYLPAVCYLQRNFFSSDGGNTKFVVRDLKSRNILWETEIDRLMVYDTYDDFRYWHFVHLPDKGLVGYFKNYPHSAYDREIEDIAFYDEDIEIYRETLEDKDTYCYIIDLNLCNVIKFKVSGRYVANYNSYGTKVVHCFWRKKNCSLLCVFT